MPTYLQALLGAGILCACSAQAVPLASGSDDPADPSAANAPYVRPTNVLEPEVKPEHARPRSASDASSPMAGMDMAGASLSGSDASGNPTHPMVGMRMPRATFDESGQAIGKLNAIDAANRTVTLTHQPGKVPCGPSLTMDYKVAPSVNLGALYPGEAVTLTFGAAEADDHRRIEQIQPR